MRSYEAARGYFGFIEFVAWALIILGVVVGFFSAASAPSFVSGVMLALPGIVLVAIGFFIIVNAQVARAAVDSAEYGQQALQLSRNQLDVSKQLLKLAQTRDQGAGYAETVKADDLKNISFDTDEPANTSATETAAITHDHNNRLIVERDGKFLFDGRTFNNLADAKAAIDWAIVRDGSKQIEAS